MLVLRWVDHLYDMLVYYRSLVILMTFFKVFLGAVIETKQIKTQDTQPLSI